MSSNFTKVKKVLWIILFANIAVAALKVIVGTVISSTSMIADGFHSFTDGSSNIVGLIGVHFASKPVDEDHPYGHGKFEMLAGLFIAGMLLMLSGKIVMDAVSRIFNPVLPDITLESLLVLLLTLVINIFVSTFEFKAGKKLNSQILISDSMHTRSDIYISSGVFATLVGVKFGLPPVIDPIVSLVVAAFIFHASYEIYKENSGILLDSAAIDAQDIRDLVMSFEDVKDAHKIRSRSSINYLHIDLHIVVNPKLDVEKSHNLVHDIEDAIKAKFDKNAQVIVHVEPDE